MCKSSNNDKYRQYRLLLSANIVFIQIEQYAQIIEAFLRRIITADELLTFMMDLQESHIELFGLFEVDSYERQILINELDKMENEKALLKISDIINWIINELIYNPKESFSDLNKFETYDKRFRIKLYSFFDIIKDF